MKSLLCPCIAKETFLQSAVNKRQ